MKIGFFDSGLGGLTIVKPTALLLQQYDYYFFGDTANLPYGDKTEEEIFALTKTGVRALFERDCVLVIIVCNTASVQTLHKLQDEFLPAEYSDRKILGVVVPTVEALLARSRQRVLLLATKRIVDSGKYQLEISHRATTYISLQAAATPELVPLIELGEIDVAAKSAITRIETEGGESEVVILGCTHYTQIKGQLRNYFGESKIILSQDEIIPEKIQEYLKLHPEVTSRLSTTGKRDIHLTKHRSDYDRVMSQLLGGVYMLPE